VQNFFNEVASLWKGAQAELHAEANGRSQNSSILSSEHGWQTV